MKKELHYLAIGDSLTAGYGAPQGRGFVDQLVLLLQNFLGVKVYVTNMGVNGATTKQIIEQLKSDPVMQRHVRRADVITITAGGNDLLRAAEKFLEDKNFFHLIAALKECQQNYRQMTGLLKQLKQQASEPYAVRMLSLYTPPSDRYMREASFCVKRFNGIVRKCKEKYFLDVNVYDAFRGRERELMYEDQIHPNEKGYRIIAEQVHRVGYAPLC